jgi:hypothetical protein
MIASNSSDLASKERRKNERVNATRKFAIGMGFAAVVGVAIGILFAPKSGKETREDIKKCCQHCMKHHGCGLEEVCW